MKIEKSKIGFMQGRLSPQLLSRIQTFPVYYWKQELYLASKLGFSQIEWTVDTPTMSMNPILSKEGQMQIYKECSRNSIKLNSVTCDFFMENPPWKCTDFGLEELKRVFRSIFQASQIFGNLILVVPLVDNSSLRNLSDLKFAAQFFYACGVEQFPITIAFESSLDASILAEVMDGLPQSIFGITLDIGNSASLGFEASQEISAIGTRIVNLHLKDRILNGSTVRFGTGNADFRRYFELLNSLSYKGNFILQSFRSSTDYVSELLYSRDYTLAMSENLISQ